jgi:hypothetical protein
MLSVPNQPASSQVRRHQPVLSLSQCEQKQQVSTDRPLRERWATSSWQAGVWWSLPLSPNRCQ